MIEYIICLIALIIGSITDLKTREVPDYLNFALIAIGFGMAILAAILNKDITYLSTAVIGFALCFIFSIIMYYTGQWGGGDAKMLMGLGAVIGLSYNEILALHVSLELPHLITFLILIFFVGGIYGSAWMGIVLIQNWKAFKKRYSETPQNTLLRYAMYCAVGFLFLAFFIINNFYFRILCITLAMMMFIFYYLFIILKVLEQVAFIKDQPINKVTEGDWIAEDIAVNGKIIISKKKCGVTKEQLIELITYAKKGKLKTVKVKYGIPFVPSFLMAFIATLVLWLR